MFKSRGGRNETQGREEERRKWEAEMRQKKISRFYAAGLDPMMDLQEAVLALAERITKLEDKTDE